MSQLTEFLRDILRYHKIKILAFLGMTVFFLVLCFPYEDLGDWATAQISELTQRQVYLQFDKMGFSVFPQPGIQFENVYMESVFTPDLKIGALSLAPSLRGLVSFKPGVTVYAEDFLNGN